MNALTEPVSAPRAHDRALMFLIQPSEGVCARVADLLELSGCRACVSDGITGDLDRADMVLIEVDRGSRAIGVIKQIHKRWPRLPIVAVRPWWDEEEVEIAGIVRFILHVPVRDDEVNTLAVLIHDVRSAALPA